MAQPHTDDPPVRVTPPVPPLVRIVKYAALSAGLAAMMAMMVPALRAALTPWLAAIL